MTCMCGDTECPSCGLAQGTLDERAVEVPCPACLDGNRWTREGPAGRCKVCNGTGILPARAVLHIPVGEE